MSPEIYKKFTVKFQLADEPATLKKRLEVAIVSTLLVDGSLKQLISLDNC